MPAARREAVEHLQEQHGFSQRRACRLTGTNRSSLFYQAQRPSDGELRQRLKELAQERPRYGYPRLTLLLRREGWRVNRKKVYRLYREENLKLRPKKRKRITSGQRVAPSPTTAINQVWAMDFLSDVLCNGRRFRTLSLVDVHSRECLALEVDTSLPGERVVRVLERLRETRGLPRIIQVDNGPEFTGHKLDQWAYHHQVKLHFIEVGKPVQNAYIESFNGKFRDECLNQEWFLDLPDARGTIEDWRSDYNWSRPHSALNNLPPAVWAQQEKLKEEFTLLMV